MKTYPYSFSPTLAFKSDNSKLAPHSHGPTTKAPFLTFILGHIYLDLGHAKRLPSKCNNQPIVSFNLALEKLLTLNQSRYGTSWRSGRERSWRKIYTAVTMSSLKKPLDLIELSIDEEVFIKCRGNRQLRGKLHVCIGVAPTRYCLTPFVKPYINSILLRRLNLSSL